ncbi:MAG: NAD-dependent protein deacetylase [Actinomycetota bacterium]|nr:NAD-dependent protein deacetylase [Actinomycetota bacterium]
MRDLAALLADGGVAVLTGAGMSTDSGIPDYRGATGQARRVAPMTYQAFVGSEAARQRYWARSHAGWPSIAAAVPNEAHRALAALSRAGLLTGTITQNVDGLDRAAGARDLVELHGDLSRVVCLGCAEVTSRAALDGRLQAANPHTARRGTMAPDGDADVTDAGSFTVVGCLTCGGMLKPDVVFFGEPVPLDRVERAFATVDAARCLLVLGSSLAVMSGYRFVLRAARAGQPVAIVNRGPTRGDPHAALRIDAGLAQTLRELADALCGQRGQRHA